MSLVVVLGDAHMDDLILSPSVASALTAPELARFPFINLDRRCISRTRRAV